MCICTALHWCTCVSDQCTLTGKFVSFPNSFFFYDSIMKVYMSLALFWLSRPRSYYSPSDSCEPGTFFHFLIPVYTWVHSVQEYMLFIFKVLPKCTIFPVFLKFYYGSNSGLHNLCIEVASDKCILFFFRYMFRSGNTEHAMDIFVNTTVEVLPVNKKQISEVIKGVWK